MTWKRCEPKMTPKDPSPQGRNALYGESDGCHRKLEQFINPLEPTQHAISLVNVSTGYITKDNAVNVEKAVELGRQQIKSFVKGLPSSSFHKAIIPKQVSVC